MLRKKDREAVERQRALVRRYYRELMRWQKKF